MCIRDSISLIAFPVAVGLYCLSALVVSLLLGPQWIEAVPIMQIVGLAGLMSALQSNMYLVILAMGQPKANTLLSASLLAVSLPVAVFASRQYGVVGAAYAHFATALLGLAGIIIVFSRVTGMAKRRLLAVMWRPLLSSGAMALALNGAAALLQNRAPQTQDIVQMLVLLPVGVILSLIHI